MESTIQERGASHKNFHIFLTYPFNSSSNQLSLVVQTVNEEGCLLKGDPWPCLLDGLPSSEGRASAYKAEGHRFNPAEVNFSSLLFPHSMPT